MRRLKPDRRTELGRKATKMLQIVVTAEVSAPTEDLLCIEVERKSMRIETLDGEAEHRTRLRIDEAHAIDRSHATEQSLCKSLFVRVPILALGTSFLKPLERSLKPDDPRPML